MLKNNASQSAAYTLPREIGDKQTPLLDATRFLLLRYRSQRKKLQSKIEKTER